VLASGRWIGVKGGTCDFGGIGVRGAAAFRERVHEEVRRGADVIKVCVSGWLADARREPERYEISDDELEAAIDEAHRLKRRVAVHAISAGGIDAAIRTGADLVVHAGFVEAKTVERMRARSIYLLPTLFSFSRTQPQVDVLALFAHLRDAIRAGLPVAFGTDAGVIAHGRNAREFESLRELGREPLEAIRMATVHAASAVGLADSIGETLARAAFPDQDPIGRRIACCEPAADGKTPDYKTVVGVVADVYSRGPAIAPFPEFYLPIQQVPPAAWDWNQRTMYVVVRTHADPQLAADALRRVVAEAAPGIPLFNIRPMEERLRQSMAPAAFNTLLLTILSVIGAILAAVGIYGVIAYFVSRRTQEIGVRMAFGASRGDVVRLVVREASLPIGIGLVLGLAASLGATRALENQRFGVTRTDPLTLAVVVLSLGAVGLLASFVPARRAASVDPTRALHMN
jgi:hypothetical protein